MLILYRSQQQKCEADTEHHNVLAKLFSLLSKTWLKTQQQVMKMCWERYQSQHKSQLRFLPSPFSKTDLCFSVGLSAEISFLVLSRLPTVKALEKKNKRKGKEVKAVQSLRRHQTIAHANFRKPFIFWMDPPRKAFQWLWHNSHPCGRSSENSQCLGLTKPGGR